VLLDGLGLVIRLVVFCLLALCGLRVMVRGAFGFVRGLLLLLLLFLWVFMALRMWDGVDGSECLVGGAGCALYAGWQSLLLFPAF
jgi:ABC-type amino acid transport system permease subunit